jgi:hypothetical protein
MNVPSRDNKKAVVSDMLTLCRYILTTCSLSCIICKEGSRYWGILFPTAYLISKIPNDRGLRCSGILCGICGIGSRVHS